LAALLLSAQPLLACPFCAAVKPTFSQRRASATSVVLAEVAATDSDGISLRVHQVLQGELSESDINTFHVRGRFNLHVGDLVLALNAGNHEQPQWELQRVDE